jgi:hypothetical protein
MYLGHTVKMEVLPPGAAASREDRCKVGQREQTGAGQRERDAVQVKGSGWMPGKGGLLSVLLLGRDLDLGRLSLHSPCMPDLWQIACPPPSPTSP